MTAFQNRVLRLRIYGCTDLLPDIRVFHPVVKIHIVNYFTGEYLVKSAKGRRVTTWNENKTTTENKSAPCDIVLPVMSRPFDFKTSRTLRALWDEEFILNEDFLSLMKPETLFLFEILDFSAKVPLLENHIYEVAWGFLTAIGADRHANVHRRLDVQLYHYPSKYSPTSFLCRQEGNVPRIWKIWHREYRRKYPATLCLRMDGIKAPTAKKVKTRPTSVFEIEEGRISWDELRKKKAGSLTDREQTRQEPSVTEMDSANAGESDVYRLHHEACENDLGRKRRPGDGIIVATKPLHKIRVSHHGVCALQFSRSGDLIAVAYEEDKVWYIDIYEVISGVRRLRFGRHYNMVYTLAWSVDDTFVVSASSDETVRVWRVFERENFVEVEGGQHVGDKILPSHRSLTHTSFVYAAQVHPTHKVPGLVATGSYDGIIRLFDIERGTFIRQLEGHRGRCLCITFDHDGGKMFSGDSEGCIRIWSSRFTGGLAAVKTSFELLREIDEAEFRGVAVVHLSAHPGARRVIGVYRDNVIRATDTRVFIQASRFLGGRYTSLPAMGEYSPDGRFVLGSGEDGKLHLWETETTDRWHALQHYSSELPIVGVQWNPSRDIVAYATLGAQGCLHLLVSPKPPASKTIEENVKSPNTKKYLSALTRLKSSHPMATKSLDPASLPSIQDETT